MFLFQSIYLGAQKANVEYIAKTYDSYPKLKVFVRDKKSLDRANSVFNKTKVVLAPDMAFQVGRQERHRPPAYDIIWLKRFDRESMKYNITKPPNVSKLYKKQLIKS